MHSPETVIFQNKIYLKSETFSIILFRSKKGGNVPKTKPAGASILKDTSRKRDEENKLITTTLPTPTIEIVEKSVLTTFKPEDTSSICSSEKDTDKSLTHTEEVEISMASPQEESGYDSDQTLSQNSSTKDSDTNSYDSPANSPRNTTKIIQPEEDQQVKTILEQVKNSSKLIQLEEAQPPNIVLELVEKSSEKKVHIEDVSFVRNPIESVFKQCSIPKRVINNVESELKFPETLFGESDILKPYFKTDELKQVFLPVKENYICVSEEKLVDALTEKQFNPSVEQPVHSIIEKPVSLTTEPVNPIENPILNPLEEVPVIGKAITSSEGKPQIAAKPHLGSKFFDKPVNTLNLRAVLQNGLNLRSTFKLRPMLSLSR
jgi:hypothetical protein